MMQIWSFLSGSRHQPKIASSHVVTSNPWEKVLYKGRSLDWLGDFHSLNFDGNIIQYNDDIKHVKNHPQMNYDIVQAYEKRTFRMLGR